MGLVMVHGLGRDRMGHIITPHSIERLPLVDRASSRVSNKVSQVAGCLV